MTSAASRLPRHALSRVPRQARSVRRVHDILDAAVAVLLADGAAGFSTNRVAEQAGVPVGSLYQYFPHKEAVVAGVLERGLLNAEGVMRAVLEQGRGRPTRDVVRDGLAAVLALLLPHRQLIVELFVSSPAFGPHSALLPIERSLHGLVDDWFGDGPRPAPAVVHAALGGGLYAFLRWLVDQPEGLDAEAFVEALAQQVTAGVEDPR